MPLRFFRPTIDSIVSNIAKQVEQLRDASARHHADHLEQVASATRASQAAQSAATERDRAAGIAARLHSLINP